MGLFGKKIKAPSNLFELLENGELIKFGSEYTSLEALFADAVSILVDHEYVKDSYTDAVINSLRSYGDYMIYPESLTAMPHARPEDGAIKTGASLIVLKEPFIYNGKSIHYVFAISSIDKSIHSGLISCISKFMEDANLVRFLHKSSIMKDYSRTLSKIALINSVHKQKEKSNLIKIITICGNGLGSSLMLAGKIEELLSSNGIKCDIDAKDFSNAKQSAADFYVSVKEFTSQLTDKEEKTITVNSYHKLSVNEETLILSKIKEKIHE